ncbi:hypothetical protein DL96DRAFT_1714648 [Flagelloscypha sp. PMI_526]|nr:hypothetical protein DL96DRAFT_1714648 [Flagelloscypha sp. PMI_526]
MSPAVPTPLVGTVQVHDVESIHPPVVPPSRIGKLFRRESIAAILDFFGFCVLASGLSCFVFFASIAVGRVIFTSHQQEATFPHGAAGEYIVSFLAGGIFILVLAGLRLICDVFGWKLPLKNKLTFGFMLGANLIIVGPLCVAASAEILRTHVANVAVGEVVVHYLIAASVEKTLLE